MFFFYSCLYLKFRAYLGQRVLPLGQRRLTGVSCALPSKGPVPAIRSKNDYFLLMTEFVATGSRSL